MNSTTTDRETRAGVATRAARISATDARVLAKHHAEAIAIHQHLMDRHGVRLEAEEHRAQYGQATVDYLIRDGLLTAYEAERIIERAAESAACRYCRPDAPTGPTAGQLDDEQVERLRHEAGAIATALCTLGGLWHRLQASECRCLDAALASIRTRFARAFDDFTAGRAPVTTVRAILAPLRPRDVLDGTPAPADGAPHRATQSKPCPYCQRQ